MIDQLPPSLLKILRSTPELAQAYLVGGCVRDWLLGVPVKDFDIEVFGLDYEGLVAALGQWGRPDLVGRSFGVVKLTLPNRQVFDFALPRRDSKVAPGHRGFTVQCDPGIELPEAAARRDFTINALMLDPRSGSVLDFFGGADDLRRRVLRHTSAAFAEDPLRVLRGMQFAARFDLVADPATVDLCRSIRGAYPELAIERVREEWLKWATQSRVPSAGLRFLNDTGWIAHFPEVAALVGVPQDPEWHPEGDVFIHTLHCLDSLVELPGWRTAGEERRAVLSFAVLAHDFGKPACTAPAERDGRTRIVSPGHEAAGAPLAGSFATRLGLSQAMAPRLPPLVANHLAHLAPATDRMVRRLARRLVPATIEELCVVMEADAFGRPPRPRVIPEGVNALREAAARLKLAADAPRPILLGRHLIARGHRPGPHFTVILEEAFEAQLDGTFGDLPTAEAWLDRRLAESGSR